MPTNHLTDKQEDEKVELERKIENLEKEMKQLKDMVKPLKKALKKLLPKQKKEPKPKVQYVLHINDKRFTFKTKKAYMDMLKEEEI